MKVFVNDTPISIFNGSRVKDAILRYCTRAKIKVNMDQIKIKDQWGNRTSDDSPLSENSKIYFE